MSHMYARAHMHTHTLEFSSDVDFLTDTMYSNFTKTIIKKPEAIARCNVMVHPVIIAQGKSGI